MELMDHLGIPIRAEITLINLIYWAKGITCLIILLYLILVYQVIAIGCTVLSAVVPETANVLRINLGNFFWDVSLYLLRLNKVKFKLIGDPLVSNPAIIVSNHVSLADYFIIHYLARVSVKGDYSPLAPTRSEKITLPLVNFFSWFLVWRVPTIKILLHMLKCDENWEIDQNSVDFVFSRLLKSKNSHWIVIFPEVNIWTREGAGLQRQLSETYFLPQFNHLLYPRFSGFYNVITALSAIKPQPYSNLYDITILYSRKDNEISYRPPSLLEFFSSKTPITVTIHIKIRSVIRIPVKRNKLERYLEHLWRNKDKLICQLKAETELQELPSECRKDV